MLRNSLLRLAEAASELNQENIKELVAGHAPDRLCDLGCNDGGWTLEVGRRSGHLHGVEIVLEQARLARGHGINAIVADLNQPLPYVDESFDLVHANQVIEHLDDVDMFLSEIYRILRRGGHTVISTENGSSWHNIGAAVLGWQIFSLS